MSFIFITIFKEEIKKQKAAGGYLISAGFFIRVQKRLTDYVPLKIVSAKAVTDISDCFDHRAVPGA